jgi:photosystem II protein
MPVVKNSVSEKKPFGYIGFTEDNEIFVGRVAMLGVAASIVGEITTGLGPIAQFSAETGLNQGQVDYLVAGLVIFNMVNALLPSSRTFSQDEQEKISTRPVGPMQDPNITIFDKQFYGISGRFGFTRENELFVGRLAQVGFAAALVFEQVYGQGPLTYFDMKTGIPVMDTEFILFASIVFSLFGAVGANKK